jgi:hypothetical protein
MFTLTNVSQVVQGPFGLITQTNIEINGTFQVTDPLLLDFQLDPSTRTALLSGFLTMTVGSATFTGLAALDYLNNLDISLGYAQYKNVSGNGTTVVKATGGVLVAVIINNNATGGTVTVYDSITGSGTVIFGILVGSPSGGLLSTSGLPGPFTTGPLDLEFYNGLTVVTAGSNNNNVTLVYR